MWTVDKLKENPLGLDKDVAGVIVGYDLHLSFMKLLKAASYLSCKESIFLATNTDAQFPLNSAQVVVPGQRMVWVCVVRL